MLKRLSALFLTISMVAGLLVMPAAAAGNSVISDLVDSYTSGSGSFTLTADTRMYLVSDTAPQGMLLKTLQIAVSQFAAAKKPATASMPIAYGADAGIRTGDIVVRTTAGLAEEAYRIVVTADNATVYYTPGTYNSYFDDISCNGLHYGLQELLKCFIVNGGNSVDCCTITDAPDTRERTVQLDCARKYWSVAWIKNLIREMSWMGYNALELHMTEEQGIRMNIWSEGADCNGNDFSWICGYTAASWASDYPDPKGSKLYSAAELREIVQLAKDYHIEIIPAVDLPGHCEQLILSYQKHYASVGKFSINYGGKTYTASRSTIYAGGSGYGVAGSEGTIDVSHEFARVLSFAIVDAYASFFGKLGCRSFGIGCDEIRLDDSDWAAFAKANGGSTQYDGFVIYTNQLTALLKNRGYSVRAFNDYLYQPSNVQLDPSLGICVWVDSDNANVQTYISKGHPVYNCHNNYTYYVLRWNSSQGDARDANNYWWSFHHSTEDRIYNEWNPSRLYAYNASSPTVTNVAGAYFLIWGDWAGWNTENQVWNGTDSNRTYNLIDRMWSNAMKMWNWDANDSCGYEEFRDQYVSRVRHFPGCTACFTDVDLTQWYQPGIDYAVRNGLFSGVGNNKFDPNGQMTRAMIVTVLHRMEGTPEVDGASNAFTDLTQDWYRAAVLWAADNGIVNGIGDGLFDPDGSLTREQLAAILMRYTDYKGGSLAAPDALKDFTDSGDISAWALEAMNWAVANSIMNGVGNSRLDPRGNATRAQVATLLMNYHNWLT